MKESKLTVVVADSPIAHRIAAVAVAFATMTGTVVLPQTVSAAPSGSSTAVSDGAKRLNTRAKELYEAGNLRASAETYAEILDELSENNVNREERDNVILLTVEVYIEAYEARRLEKDDKALPEAVALLERAVTVFDGYEAEYRRVYGGTSISPEATASGQRLRDLLERAKKEYTPPPPPEPEKEPPVIFPSGPDIDVPYHNGTGLIVGGSIMLAAGVGTVAMIIVGARMTKQANRDKGDAMTEAQADEIDQRGTTGNALIITGSILTAAFVIGGATMLGIGIHRRQRYMAFTPTVGRGYAGLSLSGRF